nr:MAG TPA: hypothetical protein [Caudoviricetes sp.]
MKKIERKRRKSSLLKIGLSLIKKAFFWFR